MKKFLNRWPGLALVPLPAAGTALAQTTAGTGVEIVLPVVSQTASSISDVSAFSPTGAAVAIDAGCFGTRNPVHAGCSIEEFPRGNFNDQVACDRAGQ